jgi:hypothetical protein
MGFEGARDLGCPEPLAGGISGKRQVGAGDVPRTDFDRPGVRSVLLPEKKNEGKGKIYADTVINGEVTELKTVSGSRATLGTDFRQGYHQGAALVKGRTETEEHSVYIRLLSDLSPGSVRAKIAGELKNRTGMGHFICYFEAAGELYVWTYDELRAIIGT